MYYTGIDVSRRHHDPTVINVTGLRQLPTEFSLPQDIQTDRKKIYGRPPTETFPIFFTLPSQSGVRP